MKTRSTRNIIQDALREEARVSRYHRAAIFFCVNCSIYTIYIVLSRIHELWYCANWIVFTICKNSRFKWLLPFANPFIAHCIFFVYIGYQDSDRCGHGLCTGACVTPPLSMPAVTLDCTSADKLWQTASSSNCWASSPVHHWTKLKILIEF